MRNKRHRRGHKKTPFPFISKEIVEEDFEYSEYCEKVMYPSQGTAKRISNNLSKRRNTFLRAYHCPDCGSWHITAKKDQNKGKR